MAYLMQQQGGVSGEAKHSGVTVKGVPVCQGTGIIQGLLCSEGREYVKDLLYLFKAE